VVSLIVVLLPCRERSARVGRSAAAQRKSGLRQTWA